MKNLIYILFVINFLGCSNNKNEQIKGDWHGCLIYTIEETTFNDSINIEYDSILTIEDQFGTFTRYEMVVSDSIEFLIKKDSIFTNAETGEYKNYLILDSDEPNKLVLYDTASVISFHIRNIDNDSLLIEPSNKPFFLEANTENSKRKITKVEYKLGKR